MANILITGGCGYIGSHTAVAILKDGHNVVIFDNLCRNSTNSLKRIEQLGNASVTFIHGDIRDKPLISKTLHDYKIHSVFHFAGLKSVGESASVPLEYYSNNVHGSCVLFEAMQAAGVVNLVFSSSATVYGDPTEVPIKEDSPIGILKNPYGRSKAFVEEILRDLVKANPLWRIAVLRYFNPVGAHESGLIGEDPNGTPSNLLPYICQVAAGQRNELAIFGNDYPTPDGTGIRDYIHIQDLAQGHLSAMNALAFRKGLNIWNLGTGRGFSVLEVIRAFEAITGKRVPYHFTTRRQGDVAICYADPAKAKRDLGWEATLGLSEMMRDAWRWQSLNPIGYQAS